ncbi:MAG: ribosome maturation factor RimM [Oryzomonas sp.]|jgi:16S rRNA processing protein RimM
MSNPDELIAVGRISGTHGIKGQLKVQSYSGNLESLSAARIVTLRSPGGATLREIGIKGVKPHSNGFILILNDYDDIDRALPLVGSELFLKRSQLPEPEDDEYYWCDLIGLRVVTADGIELGTLDDIFETGSNDIYVVRKDKQEYLIPAIASVISSVDLAGGTMVITPMDGLLDL